MDVTAQAGSTWRQFAGESPDRFLIETMGGGAAFLDFDGDGLLDIFFVNGGETPRGKSSSPVRNALYRNLGNGKFEDLAAKAGVDRIGFYGMGVAVANGQTCRARVGCCSGRCERGRMGGPVCGTRRFCQPALDQPKGRDVPRRRVRSRGRL